LEFPINLDPASKLPLYRQLSDAFRQAIQAGRLGPGDQLPATRDIAGALGLARGTVVRAYNELLSTGYAEGKIGTGTMVSKDLPKETITNLEWQNHQSFGETKGLSDFARRLENIPKVESTSADLPELNYGCAPQNLLPIRQWREILLSHCRPQDQTQLSYVTEPFGYRPLREAVARFLTRTKAVHCHPDQVIMFSGPQQALNTIATLLLDRGDTVVVENPGYVGAREVFLAHGADLRAQSIDENGIVTQGLRDLDRCKIVHVSPSCHDPSGVVTTNDRRAALLDFAKRSGAYIVEDAWDTDYRYFGPAVPSLQGMSGGQSVIYLYTFWKVLFPLTTACATIIPAHLIPAFTRAKLLLERQFPVLEHYALTDFVNDGVLDSHIMKTRKIYQQRRQALFHALSTAFRQNIHLPQRSAGLHLVARFNLDKSEEQILEAAKQADLPMVSTRLYYTHDFVRNEFLIPFSCQPDETIADRVQSFAQSIL
jgi:GntR family transcriptional regulator/MocR family aminotransferase